MERGSVQRWDAGKGFGFVRPNAGGPYVFIHARVLRAAGVTEIGLGDCLRFSTVIGRGSKPEVGACQVFRTRGHPRYELRQD